MTLAHNRAQRLVVLRSRTLPDPLSANRLDSAERPAWEIPELFEGIVEQLTTLPGADVSLKLEIYAEIPGGLDLAKIRSLIEKATTRALLIRL